MTTPPGPDPYPYRVLRSLELTPTPYPPGLELAQALADCADALIETARLLPIHPDSYQQDRDLRAAAAAVRAVALVQLGGRLELLAARVVAAVLAPDDDEGPDAVGG